jgi:hypothetical protein
VGGSVERRWRSPVWASASVGTPHLHNCAILRSPELRVCTSAWFLRTKNSALVRIRRSQAGGGLPAPGPCSDPLSSKSSPSNPHDPPRTSALGAPLPRQSPGGEGIHSPRLRRPAPHDLADRSTTWLAQGLAVPVARGLAVPVARGLAVPVARGLAVPVASGLAVVPVASGLGTFSP